jgi:rubrerythrin
METRGPQKAAGGAEVATIREALDRVRDMKRAGAARTALTRLAARIEELEREIEGWIDSLNGYAEEARVEQERAEAAEAEAARLRGRIATADRYLKKAENEKTHGLTANAEYIDGMVAAARIALAAKEPADDCSNCDGKGHNTAWPHTTCPVCEGSGEEPADV